MEIIDFCIFELLVSFIFLRIKFFSKQYFSSFRTFYHEFVNFWLLDYDELHYPTQANDTTRDCTQGLMYVRALAPEYSGVGSLRSRAILWLAYARASNCKFDERAEKYHGAASPSRQHQALLCCEIRMREAIELFHWSSLNSAAMILNVTLMQYFSRIRYILP